MKVFYSWQSDTPNKVGRTFVRACLDAAVAGLDLEEAARPVIDQDTAGVLGSPVIADTIFQKIREAKVVVADVTLTGATPNGKRLCNSNVAIELGYALGVNGDEVLLKVMNTHYGPPSDLPFDLTHRRWPVQFNLPPDAEPAERRKVRDALTSELRAILDAYVIANRPPVALVSKTPSTYNAAAYWQSGESLAKVGDGAGKTASLLYQADQPLIYLRVWPSVPVVSLTSTVLSDYTKASIEPLCGGITGWSHERNRHGTLTYATHRSSTELASTTQVFKSGEIWGINEHLLRKQAEYPLLVPMNMYENRLRSSLTKYLDAARNRFGYPAKVMVESGLVNVAEFSLAVSDHFRGPIYEDVKVTTELDMDNPDTITAALLKIFEAVFEAAGAPRPQNLGDFPRRAT